MAGAAPARTRMRPHGYRPHKRSARMVPSASTAASTSLSISRPCIVDRKSSSGSQPWLPTTQLASKRDYHGFFRVDSALAPKPPPTSGLTTRNRSAAISSAVARSVRARNGAWWLSWTITRRRLTPVSASTPRSSIGTAATRACGSADGLCARGAECSPLVVWRLVRTFVSAVGVRGWRRRR